MAISIWGNLKRIAALHGVQRGASEISKAEAFRVLERLFDRLHDPLTWRSDVQSALTR